MSGAADQPPTLLRIVACGSVDDGKSTLIGRLLHDTRSVPRDQLRALAQDSDRYGTTGGLDFALLVDGLIAEREQAITIDVAHRAFATAARRFMVADAPGHEQYTRNMATAASTADLAVVLVDATQGLVAQTHRHLLIASLMGVRHAVLAVNKIDQAGFDPARFATIEAQFARAVDGLGFATTAALPVCARDGDNVVAPSSRLPWYRGPTLLAHLEQAAPPVATARPFRMPVQWVNRPHSGFRGFSGTIASGRIAPGDRVMVAASGLATTVARLVIGDRPRASAGEGEAVTLLLADPLDVSRGDVLCGPDAPVELADQFQAHLVWLAGAPLINGRGYLMKLATRTLGCTATRLKYRIDPDTRAHLSAEALGLNDIGVANLATVAPVAFAPYAENRTLGGFILIDRLSHATLGVGMIDFALRRSTNVTWQALDVDRAARAALKGQRAAVLWFTGLSGSGKSTLANLVERALHAEGRHTTILDGDNLRHGLNRDLGFTEADRVENIRRVAEVAVLMADAGLIVLVSFISPYRAERQAAREKFPPGDFFEVFVDTPIAVCRARDPKGLYARADAGLIRNFTGIDAPYEAPLAPDIHLRTVEAPPEALAARLLDELRRRGVV